MHAIFWNQSESEGLNKFIDSVVGYAFKNGI
jgi:hypothetical protein